MDKKNRFSFKKLIVPGAVMLAFWSLALAMWLSSGQIMALFFFGYIGTSVGVGLGLYAALPRKKKPLGRRLALILVGTFLFGFAAVKGLENMQIEGFFFGLLAGSVTHVGQAPSQFQAANRASERARSGQWASCGCCNQPVLEGTCLGYPGLGP